MALPEDGFAVVRRAGGGGGGGRGGGGRGGGGGGSGASVYLGLAAQELLVSRTESTIAAAI